MNAVQIQENRAEVEQRLQTLADSYLDQLQAGTTPDRQALLADHPDLAVFLERRLALVDLMHRLAAEPNSDLDGSATLPPAQESPELPAVEDFEILRLLGRGTFGKVYLARQRSLGRLVALKVTVNHGSEAHTLASLEHDHIVRVFSETVDRDTDQRLLCMQYVVGTTLEQIIGYVGQQPRCDWTGRTLLEAMDSLCADPICLEAAALRDREFLGNCSFVEAVCWLGARLADALAHAHRHGVLHRDIKPANILIHVSGRPLLADFNLALDPHGLGASANAFGGTLSYMAPEHLDAFNSAHATPQEAVDERSDIYALGLVLFELLTGRRPFAQGSCTLPRQKMLQTLAMQRRAQVPSPRRLNPEIPEVLDRTIRCCLQPDPQQRYQTAAELAQVLEGCQELCQVKRTLPPSGFVARMASRHPFVLGLLLPLLPHLVCAALANAYALHWVASHPARQPLESFIRHGLSYCAVVFPLAGGLAYCLTRKIWRTLVQVRSSAAIAPMQATGMRRWAMRSLSWACGLSALGWLPGAVILPLLCYQVPECAAWQDLLHYLLSDLVAGLVALTYTELAGQFLILNVVYPELWVDPKRPRETARAELGPVGRRLRICQMVAGLIALSCGIALVLGLVGAGPEQRGSDSHQAFLLLVILLMVLGLVGGWLAVVISGRLSRTLAALTGAYPGESLANLPQRL